MYDSPIHTSQYSPEFILKRFYEYYSHKTLFAAEGFNLISRTAVLVSYSCKPLFSNESLFRAFENVRFELLTQFLGSKANSHDLRHPISLMRIHRSAKITTLNGVMVFKEEDLAELVGILGRCKFDGFLKLEVCHASTAVSDWVIPIMSSVLESYGNLTGETDKAFRIIRPPQKNEAKMSKMSAVERVLDPRRAYREDQNAKIFKRLKSERNNLSARPVPSFNRYSG